MMETNSTRTRFLAKLFSVLLISTFFNQASFAQSCACKEAVQVSLNDAGTATVTAAMLLADAVTCDAGAGAVAVMLTPTGTPIPGSPVVNCSHIGKTLYGKVFNAAGTNSCWTKLTIEDKIKPVITCPTGVMVLNCTQMSTFLPTVNDNCLAFTLDTISETVTVNDCNSGLGANILKRVVRTYQATDASGNVSVPCTITFDVTTIPSLDDIVPPASYTVLGATALECDGPWAKLANDYPSPVTVGTADGTGVPTLGGLDLYPDPNLYCNLMISYSDTKLPKIGCVTKIMRQWKVIEWSCANRTRDLPLQMIEIVDSEGPSISGLENLFISTSNHSCEGNAVFAAPTVVDNCDAVANITVDITVFPNGGADAGVFIKHGSPKTASLPVGTHTVVYTAYDGCYNSTTASIVIEVEDNTPPVAICDEFATIGVTSDGTAWIPASVFDDGSYDECGLSKMLVRKMNSTSCAPCETPEFPGFTLLGQYDNAGTVHYYYLSQHEAMPGVAYKTAKAMGGYVVSYESLAEATFVGEKAYAVLPADYNRLLIGLTDRVKEGTFRWESGASTSYVMPWANNEPDGSGDYVVQRRNLNWRDIGNDEGLVKYVVEITDPCGWTSYAKFCCDDISADPNNPLYRMVGFRVIDQSGNYNDCMVSAVIQDKLGPQITCPADQTVGCEFAYDPSNLRKDFGWPTATDNCEKPTITQDSSINITGCRVGSITRTFTVTDRGGRTASCTQTITFRTSATEVYSGPTAAQWPADVTIPGCGDPTSATLLPEVLGSPVLSDGACSLVGAQYVDQSFSFNNPTSPACFKILRKWTVIDWCKMAPNVAPDGTTYPSQQVEFVNSWTHTQEIKVIDDVAPVIAAVSPSVSADTYDAACLNGFITLGATATDACTQVLKWNYKIDAGNNGGFDIFDSGNGNSINASNTYPVGTHKIVYSFEDKCGNVSSVEQLFSIVNKKAPNAYVKNGLAISLMDQGNGEGMAEIWASDFDNGSSHPCNYPVLLSFTKVTKDLLGNMVGSPNITFTCNELGRNDIVIYVAVLTPAGDIVESTVETFIDVQDNNDICGEGRLVVNGTLSTETNDLVQNVFVSLLGSELSTISNEAGNFQFGNMNSGGAYQVNPSKNDDHLNGVSTLDLVMIQRHILAIDKLNSPYKLIAADVTKDGKISAADLVELRKLVLGTTTTFANNTSWRFVDKNYSFQDATFAQGEAFPETYDIANLNTNMVTDFTAVKVGDVNGNAKANNFSNALESRSNDKLVLTTKNDDFVKGQKVVIPVSAAKSADVLGMQFTINFDNNALTLSNIEAAELNVTDSNFGFTHSNDGKITVSYNDANITSMSAGEALFTLTFTANEAGNTQDVMSIGSEITAAEAYNADANVMSVEWMVSNRNTEVGFALYQNTPNPFKDNTVVAFELPTSMEAKLTIFDVTGKVVRNVYINGVKGYNSVEINKNDITAGVMYYSLSAGAFSATKKMVVIE